ncbi:tetratricopeptide repeat protein [Terasakiella pusilla]|uniref:tetratricopeptide repeat protein n=1 Tax=Terasakiella pusilla TaxID=64973 RepID=UPI003AA8558A
MDNISTDDLKVLMEAGFLAANGGMTKQAQTIFEGVLAVRPESEYAYIGQAVTLLTSEKHDEAIKVLRDDALRINPDCLQAKMILAMTLKLAGRGSECDRVVDQLHRSGDSAAKEFANALFA